MEKHRIITPRRAVDLPWYGDGRYYELVGRRGGTPKMAKSPWAYACMQIRGQELANIPWHIKDAGGEILESHPLIPLLEDFGDESSWQRSMLYTEMDLLLHGAALWLYDADELVRLDPSTIEVKKNKQGITGFWQYLGDKAGEPTNKFTRDEVVYFREYHPEDDLDFGIPTVEVCKKSIAAEVEALLMIEALYKNDAVPGLYLGTEQPITEKEADRVITWWNMRFRGGRNKGKVGVGGKGLKPWPVGSNMKDAMVVELLDSVRNDICVAFRVPKILVGSQQDATYVNLNESRKFLIEDVMIPRAIELANVINQDLVPQVDPGVIFEFAFDELQILQEDSTQKHTRLAQAVQMGLITKEYYVAEMGYPAEAMAEDEPDPGQEAEDKWQRKAQKALQRGESPAVEFETDQISVDRQYLIRARLSNAQDEAAVRAAFK